MAKYYQTSNNSIYKMYDGKTDYVGMTPNTVHKITDFKMLDNPIEIKKQRANFLINDSWKKYTSHWSYNGKKYKTTDIFINLGFEKHGSYYTSDKVIIPTHKFQHTYKNGKIYYNEYYLASYRGNLIWVTTYSQYLPQVYCYHFEGIDIEPSKHGFYTNIKSIKAVYCITDKKLI